MAEKKKLSTGQGLMVMILTIGVLVAIRAGRSSSSAAAAAPPAPVAKVTAAALASAYEANEVSGDEQFKGKVVQISGRVSSIGKDISDDSYVVLAGRTGEMLRDVQVYFATSDQKYLGRLRKGDEVEVAGEVDGLMGNVLVKEAKLETAPERVFK